MHFVNKLCLSNFVPYLQLDDLLMLTEPSMKLSPIPHRYKTDYVQQGPPRIPQPLAVH